MISRILRYIAACLMVGSVTAMAGQTENEKIAVSGAEKWLGIVDSSPSFLVIAESNS